VTSCADVRDVESLELPQALYIRDDSVVISDAPFVKNNFLTPCARIALTTRRLVTLS